MFICVNPWFRGINLKTSDSIFCKDFPCIDVNKKGHVVPSIDLNPKKVKLIMISESPPLDSKDYFYSPNEPFYLKTTLQSFHDAGIKADNINDLIKLGVYLTTAVKCAKTQYAISPETIKTCSLILEKELELFPNVIIYMLMGDVAIKSVNHIAKRTAGIKVIPSGS